MPDYLIKHRVKHTPVEQLAHLAGPFETQADAEAYFAAHNPGSEVIPAEAPPVAVVAAQPAVEEPAEVDDE